MLIGFHSEDPKIALHILYSTLWKFRNGLEHMHPTCMYVYMYINILACLLLLSVSFSFRDHYIDFAGGGEIKFILLRNLA